MKPKQKKFAIFAACVFVVVGYAVYDYRSVLSEAKKSTEQKRVFPLDPDQVQKLVLKTNGQEIAVERDVKGWKMTKPAADVADGEAIEKYIDGISTETAQETVVEGDKVELANFGLDQPKGELELILNSGESHRFQIGSRKNYQGDAYLRKDGENKVQIASSTWFTKLDKTAVDFRDKRLMRRSNASTEKITFEKGSEKFQLSKKDAQWFLDAHPDWKLDQNKVRELLGQLNSTEVLEFIAEGNAKSEELKKWGLQPAQFRLTMEASKDSGLKPWVADFAMGSDKVGRVHVSEPDFVLKIAPSELGKFQILSADGFRDRAEPFQFDRAKVKKLDIKLGSKSFHLNSEDEKGKEILGLLEKMTIADFSKGPDARYEQEISLKGDGDQEVFHLKWGALRSVTDAKGSRVSVFSAQASGYPHEFNVSESDINSLNLNDLIKKESVK